MKNILYITIITILFTGCGSDSSNAGNEPIEETNDVNMTVGRSYNVFPNNKIIKRTQDALVKISHVDNARASSVILLSGSATILRNLN